MKWQLLCEIRKAIAFKGFLGAKYKCTILKGMWKLFTENWIFFL